jgi:hypothetical protein
MRWTRSKRPAFRSARKIGVEVDHAGRAQAVALDIGAIPHLGDHDGLGMAAEGAGILVPDHGQGGPIRIADVRQHENAEPLGLLVVSHGVTA